MAKSFTSSTFPATPQARKKIHFELSCRRTLRGFFGWLAGLLLSRHSKVAVQLEPSLSSSLFSLPPSSLSLSLNFPLFFPLAQLSLTRFFFFLLFSSSFLFPICCPSAKDRSDSAEMSVMKWREGLELGRKVIAIGRNYSEHAKELGNQVPQELFFFLKPTSSIIKNGEPIEIPAGAEVHHEVELGVIIGKKGRDISTKDSYSYIDGYCLALDMTARNLQNAAKKAGLPWSAAKGYDTFCPVSEYIPKDKIKDPQNINLWLKVNSQIRQNGNTSDMIFKIDDLISKVSRVMTLEPGDLILTGTPSGVGQVKAGDIIISGIADLIKMENPVVDRSASKL